jgi:hypothetical protein
MEVTRLDVRIATKYCASTATVRIAEAATTAGHFMASKSTVQRGYLVVTETLNDRIEQAAREIADTWILGSDSSRGYQVSKIASIISRHLQEETKTATTKLRGAYVARILFRAKGVELSEADAAFAGECIEMFRNTSSASNCDCSTREDVVDVAKALGVSPDRIHSLPAPPSASTQGESK